MLLEGGVRFMYVYVYIFNTFTEYRTVNSCPKNCSNFELVLLLQETCRNSGAGFLIMAIQSKNISTEFYWADSSTEGPCDPEVCDP